MKRYSLTPTQRLTLIGLFGAVTIVLSALESILPALPVPGARLGLANVAVTAALVLIGPVNGAAVALLKIVFVLLTRGMTAALMAGGGTTLAVLVTLLLLPLYEHRFFSFLGVCVSASAAHTVGQLLCATLLLSPAVWSYAPLMLLVALPTGIVTGTLLNLLIPRLKPLVTRR